MGYLGKQGRSHSSSLIESGTFLAEKILFIIGAIVLVSSTALAGSLNYNAAAWDTTAGWQKSNIVSYAEGDCIPVYFQLDNSNNNQAVSESTQWGLDYSNGATLGLLGFECCGCTVCPSASPLSCCAAGGSDITTCPKTGAWTLTASSGDIHYYTWSYTVPAHATITQCACARISNEAANFPGASMQIRTPAGTLSIPTSSIRTPNLNVRKTAIQNCDEIAYTITYNNAGTASQINTILIDTYDKAQVTPKTGTFDGTVDPNAGTITWSLGTVGVGSTGTKTFTVKINNGGCSGTIINRVRIYGDLAEVKTNNRDDTLDNNYELSTAVIPDATKPVISKCPLDIVIECPNLIQNVPKTLAEFLAEGGAVTDICGTLSASYNDAATGTCPEITTRTWTVTDTCGNTATCQQKITRQDITPPVITKCPLEVQVECPNPIPAPKSNDWNGFVAAGGAATDTCDSALKASYSDAPAIGTCPELVIRTWTVTDYCGNKATCNQKIYRDDSTPPLITTCPADITVTCENEIPKSSNDWNGFYASNGRATDTCDSSLEASYTTTISSIPSRETIYTRTWKVIDDCGNFDECQQIITVTNAKIDVHVLDSEFCIADIAQGQILTGTVDNYDSSKDTLLWTIVDGSNYGKLTDPVDPTKQPTHLSVIFTPIASGGDYNTVIVRLTATRGSPCSYSDYDDGTITVYQIPAVEIHILSPPQQP